MSEAETGPEKKKSPAPAPDPIGAAARDARPLVKNVNDLLADVRNRVDELLVDGATLEDVVEALEEDAPERVTLQAVATYFRSNGKLQQRRVRRMVERAQELKAALKDPESAEGDLADAVLMTGFLCLNRKNAELNLKDVGMMGLRRQYLALQVRLARLRDRKERQDIEIKRRRMELDEKKFDLLQQRIRQAYEELKGRRGDATLGEEAFRKIQEIYGIVQLPTIPATELTR